MRSRSRTRERSICVVEGKSVCQFRQKDAVRCRETLGDAGRREKQCDARTSRGRRETQEDERRMETLGDAGRRREMQGEAE